ncbi:hypothetical protein ACSBR2_011807 [Camellia fascicularis]
MDIRNNPYLLFYVFFQRCFSFIINSPLELLTPFQLLNLSPRTKPLFQQVEPLKWVFTNQIFRGESSNLLGWMPTRSGIHIRLNQDNNERFMLFVGHLAPAMRIHYPSVIV